MIEGCPATREISSATRHSATSVDHSASAASWVGRTVGTERKRNRISLYGANVAGNGSRCARRSERLCRERKVGEKKKKQQEERSNRLYRFNNDQRRIDRTRPC